MALLPMEQLVMNTDQSANPSPDQNIGRASHYTGETQESMFDEPAALADSEAYETSYEATDEASSESSFEPADDFADDVPGLISYQSGSGHAGIDPISEPALEPEKTEPELAQEELLEAPVAAPVEEKLPEPVESAAETIAEPEPAAPTMLTADDFAALEERVLRAVALVRSERQARIAAEERVSAMEAQLHSFEAQIQQIEAQSPTLERLAQEVESLRTEREQVRQRVERLLGQLDALEL